MTTTQTETLQSGSIRLRGPETGERLPAPVKERLDAIPKLSREQAGHLRHFHNLASQLDGDWSFFGTQDPGQEWLDAIRYQLAIMTYATAAAHFHRLPALRGPMRELFQKLIKKMLRRDVWGYWYLTSQSGIMVDPDLKELRKPWADPVKEENIMYSGHLLLMVAMYEMLFDSNEYEQEGSITFNWDPVFWGFGPEKFEYSRKSLQTVILKEMEKNGWVGVCCEPNMVFIVCNQFPLTAMRFADAHLGTNVIDEVLPKYKAAIKKKNMMHERGWFADAYRVKQDQALPAAEIAFTAWACNFMNGWNSEQVHASYSSQALGTLTKREDGRVNVERPDVAMILRTIAESGKGDPNDKSTRDAAIKEADSELPGFAFPYTKPIFGLAAGVSKLMGNRVDLNHVWVSEVAPLDTVKGILKHADTYLNPSWSNGGLYYPRHDEKYDRDGNWKFVDPVTGNACIGYARLNVPDGQKTMWEKAWTPEQVQRSVAVEGVGFGSGVDFLRCKWANETEDGFNGLVVTMRTWHGKQSKIHPKIVALPAGWYEVFINSKLNRMHDQEASQTLELDLDVDGNELDICILKK